jgi:hypothetical protein
MQEELWKDITGFEGYYQLSNLANLRSVDRVSVDTRGRPSNLKGRLILGRKISNKGYLNVALSKCGVKKHIIIHSTVASLFSHKTADATQVNHKDGNKRNNVASNLEWVTGVENIAHSIVSGLRNKGIKPLDTGSRYDRYAVL